MGSFIKTTRAICRLAGIVAATTLIFCIFYSGMISLAGMPRWARRWRSFQFGLWARIVALIIGMKLHVHRAAPRPPFMLVANHLSYIDVIAFAASMDCVFVAKSDVEAWPVIGLLCRTVGTIFIDRRQRRDIPRALGSIRQKIAGGSGVVLFAEGTSTAGNSVHRFKPSLLEHAASDGLPVHYATLSYRTGDGLPPAHQAVCWWGDMTFGGHLFDLLKISSFRADIVFGNTPILARDRKTLARDLWTAVASAFHPIIVSE